MYSEYGELNIYVDWYGKKLLWSYVLQTFTSPIKNPYSKKKNTYSMLKEEKVQISLSHTHINKSTLKDYPQKSPHLH